jgi:hypothetical protein
VNGANGAGARARAMQNRTAILKEAEIFGARAVDSSTEGFALEATGDPEKLDEFIDVMRSYGEIEVTRSGAGRRVARNQEAALAPPVAKNSEGKNPQKTGNGVLKTLGNGKAFYEKDGNLPAERQDRRHYRLWQPGSRARAESARFRRQRDRRLPEGSKSAPRPKPPG